MIVWATTFSLLTLFLPKLHAFFFPDKDDTPENIRKASDLSGRQKIIQRKNAIGIAPDSPEHETCDELQFTPPIFDYDNQSDMMDLNYIVNDTQHPLHNSQVKLNNISRKGRAQGVIMEVHEVLNFPPPLSSTPHLV